MATGLAVFVAWPVLKFVLRQIATREREVLRGVEALLFYGKRHENRETLVEKLESKAESKLEKLVAIGPCKLAS